MVNPSLAVRSTKVRRRCKSSRPKKSPRRQRKCRTSPRAKLACLEAAEACKITDLERLKKIRRLRALEVQAFRLNDETAIVTAAVGNICEFGLAIKAASPFKTTLVIELANDDLAYIPTKQAFVEGSYEVTNSRVEPGTGEKLAEAAIGLLKELK